MPGKIAVITDSISCLPKELTERYRIDIVPIRITYKGDIYRDLVDLTPTKAYEMLMEDPEHFNTSPSSPGHFLEAYKKAGEWAEGILCLTLSSKLSMGFESARLAMEEAKNELPGITIKVMDSQNVTAAEGFIALAAARASENGAGMEGVIREAERIRDKVSFYALLETIKYVYRTGRIPKIASQIGSALNIKPLLGGADGLVKFKGVVSNRSKGLDKLVETMREGIGNRPAHIAIMHAHTPDEAEAFRERVASEFNCTELWISEFTPVMGYATGVGTLAIAFYADDQS
ncbi:MAG: DegV family protein [Dehalococcoidales bacterium]|nr:DegV family protein [Dehalococcoidales bacterium]